jgi:hypothetical protein
MHYLQIWLYEYPILAMLQAAFTVWMLVDSQRHGHDYRWFWVILVFQPIGPWIYFLVEKRKHLDLRLPFVGGWFERKAPLEELQFRVQQAATVANQLDLAERLIELGRHEEAVAPLERVLAVEPDLASASFQLAKCHYELGRAADAEPLLVKIVKKDPRFDDYAAWRLLLLVQEDQKKDEVVLETARQLVRTSPRMQHKVLLAGQLVRLNHDGEARLLLENALQEQQFVNGPSRRVNRPWIKEAKRLLRDLSPT